MTVAEGHAEAHGYVSWKQLKDEVQTAIKQEVTDLVTKEKGGRPSRRCK